MLLLLHVLCVTTTYLLHTLWQVLAKLKSITHELESKELDGAAKNLQVRCCC